MTGTVGHRSIALAVAAVAAAWAVVVGVELSGQAPAFHHHTLLNRLSQFGLEGYWALLIGQKVPYERPYVPSERERQTWRQIQEAFKAKALWRPPPAPGDQHPARRADATR